MGAGALPPTPSGSGNADVGRASQLQHAVEHVDSDVHLGRPTLLRMRAQPVADHLLPFRNGGLGLGAFRVPGRPLPGSAPVVGDMLEVAVARGGTTTAYRAIPNFSSGADPVPRLVRDTQAERSLPRCSHLVRCKSPADPVSRVRVEACATRP